MSLAGLFEKTSLKTNSEEINVLEQYAELILEWNSTRNLVSRNTNKEQINEHILDCACITSLLDENKILDVGTGAGLPGIVVSILESKKKVTLLEPNQKKVSFLTHVQAELGLTNLKIEKGRVEDLKKIKEEIIMTRAVMEPEKLLASLSKLREKKFKIIMMVSEPKADLGPDWKVNYVASEAQNILQKKRGFLNITNNKN
ncbi:16S rRNA (guanine(527)-N(7))-methyltransferase RsmG [SAR86 cluster bacterium]|nr:16S rRNA (guanine(527)-N(7))-methyltransferase RsmG [SAR86 cluster bacterium]